MANFEWRTGEEDSWEDIPPENDLSPNESNRSWIVWGGVITAVILAAFMTYRQLDRQVQEVSATTTSDLLASVDVRQKAILEGDAELFDSVLSGANLNWTGAQQTLFSQNSVDDRWQIGFSKLPESSEALTVTMSPDLISAEVVMAQAYAFVDDKGVQSKVTLHRTDVYRRGNVRWLYSPPTDEFWGQWRSENGRYLTLIFPERDYEIAQRLIVDLDNRLATYCQERGLCGKLTVRLDKSPISLLLMSDLEQTWRRMSNLELSAPSLVGLPTDDEGYEALLDGYSVPILSMAILRSWNYECCEKGLFVQALIDKKLSELGVKHWPLTPDVYESIFQEPILRADQLHRFWSKPPNMPLAGGEWPLIYHTIDFLMEQDPENSTSELFELLQLESSYTGWLDASASSQLASGVLYREWLAAVQEQLEETAVSLPNQQIALLCRAGSQRTRLNSVYYLDPETGDVSPIITDRNLLYMASMADDSGILLHEQQPILNQSQLWHWQDGIETVIESRSMGFGLFYVKDGATSEQLTLFNYDFADDVAVHSLLDCGGETCQNILVDGTPHWSQNGRFAINQTLDNHLSMIDTSGAVVMEIGTGFAPFWLGEVRYGFIRTAFESGLPKLEIYTLEGGEIDAQWSLSVLTQTLPANFTFADLNYRAVMSDPHDEDVLFVGVTVDSGDAELTSLLFRFDLELNEADLVYETPFLLNSYHPLTISPDDRYLIATTFAQSDTQSEIFLYEFETGEVHTLGSNNRLSSFRHDWSADGRWLMRIEEDFLHLYSPMAKEQKVILHELPSCNHGSWVNSNR